MDLLCLLLNGTEQLVTHGGAELAVMVVEDLLHLQDALAAEVVQAPLLVALLGARARHELCSTGREPGCSYRLPLWRLGLLHQVLDLHLVVVDRLEEVVLSLWSVDVLGLLLTMVKVDALVLHVVHLHWWLLLHGHLVVVVVVLVLHLLPFTGVGDVLVIVIVVAEDIWPVLLHHLSLLDDPGLSVGRDQDATGTSALLGCDRQIKVSMVIDIVDEEVIQNKINSSDSIINFNTSCNNRNKG